MTIAFRSIEISRETYGENEGKYKSRITFDVGEDITVFAKADAIITAQLVEVLTPVFEKVTNEKYEKIKDEAGSFLTKIGFRRKGIKK